MKHDVTIFHDVHLNFSPMNSPSASHTGDITTHKYNIGTLTLDRLYQDMAKKKVRR